MTPKVFSQARFNLQNLIQVLSLLIISCLIFGCLEVSSFQTTAANLVYCPLQKTWVKKSASEPQLKSQTLNEICATDARKNSFQLELSLRTSHPVTENIFFDYLETGAKVFSALNKPNDRPPRPLLKRADFEIAATNFSQNFDHHAPAKLETIYTEFPQYARKKFFSNFDFQRIFSLEKISRNINPRSPPFFV